MIRCLHIVCAVTMCAASASAQDRLPPPPRTTDSPWNGTWRLSPDRNPRNIRDAAAQDYRFSISADGRIRWEIPSLHEIGEGRTDGVPFPIRRPGTSGLSIAVEAEGRQVLTYRVFRDGKPEGVGRMTLAEQDRSWVDISGPVGRPDLAGIVVYGRT